MVTHHVGRFSIDVPETMRVLGQSFSIRDCGVEVVDWPPGVRSEEARDGVLASRIADLQRRKPRSRTPIIQEVRELAGLGLWARGVRHTADSGSPGFVSWAVLVDYGTTGVWVEAYGREHEIDGMVARVQEVAGAYRHPGMGLPGAASRSGFSVERGWVVLPFLGTEELTVRFGAADADTTFMIHMRTALVVKGPGLIERLTAAIATRFAPGVQIKTLRSRKRIVAGLPGEEVLLRGTENGRTRLGFNWLYLGQPDSGTGPRIELDLESAPEHEKETIALWDRILDSIRLTNP